MDRNTIKPTLMQLAEPEYMCECGYKLYVYPQNKNLPSVVTVVENLIGQIIALVMEIKKIRRNNYER
ncbi:hypothetical protein CYK68_14530 [Clostridium perfringens]|nr:hypothetical protein CYK68_14530 [Clostridium perfringens]PWX14729.1 hypothetical protein CYK66_14885 [Clostridium perfringens]